jgi:hypothetical protein
VQGADFGFIAGEQWEKLLGMADEIRNFIRENDHSLKKKE